MGYLYLHTTTIAQMLYTGGQGQGADVRGVVGA